MKLMMLTAYLIALHLLLGLLLWKSDFLPRVMDRLAGNTHSEELTKHFRYMRAYHSRSAAIVPEGSVFFIGDSIIQGLCVDAVIQPAVNYGIGGDTTMGVLERMGDYAFGRASAVVLSIGGNDLKYRDPEAVVANMEKIIARIDPHIPVIVSAVPLADEDLCASLRDLNATITRLNSLLQQLTVNSPRLSFVDHSNLTQNGQLRRNLHIGDGMHPNNEGNRILAANLRMAILDVLGQQKAPAHATTAPATN
ncbi:MAG: GDSL-type esterase/lipase family protein [Verrucomicrobia bacterium]|nr:GDSL-type esterase/lipase family protein [Verrucomicrobiota bacterium]